MKTLTVFIYKNKQDVYCEFTKKPLPALEVVATCDEEAHSILCGYDLGAAENILRDDAIDHGYDATRPATENEIKSYYEDDSIVWDSVLNEYVEND